MTLLTETQKTELELLVDAQGLTAVLCELVNICDAKAEHLRSNWQDETAAKTWEKDARRIDRTITTIQN